MSDAKPNPPPALPSAPSWWKFWQGSPESVLARATVFLAIATLLLAMIAGIQAWILATTDTSTREAADAAAKSAKAAETALQLTKQEQRPIIWLTNLGGPRFMLDKFPSDPTTRQIVWDWHYTNYGKTPALHLSYHDFIVIGNKREEGFSSKIGGIEAEAAPVPTAKDDITSVVSPPAGIKPEKFARLMQTDAAIGIEGAITYNDAAGVKYKTTFCLTHLALGAILYCKGNDIK
jgi:hypothetical protein